MLGYQIVLNAEIKHNPVAVLYGDTELQTAFLGRNKSPRNLTHNIHKEPIRTIKTPSLLLATGIYEMLPLITASKVSFSSSGMIFKASKASLHLLPQKLFLSKLVFSKHFFRPCSFKSLRNILYTLNIYR